MASFAPLRPCCLQSRTPSHCRRFISGSSCTGWALPGSARCEGGCCGRGLARVGSVPQPDPPPRGSLSNGSSSWPSTEHFHVPRPVPALSVYISPHPAAGTIMMPLCRWARKDPSPRLPQWLSWAWTPGLHPWQQAAPGACGHKNQKQMHRVQEVAPARRSAGLAWQGPKLSLPITRPPPPRAGWRMRLGPREHRLALAVLKYPVGRVTPPASSLQALGSRPGWEQLSHQPCTSSQLPISPC